MFSCGNAISHPTTCQSSWFRPVSHRAAHIVYIKFKRSPSLRTRLIGSCLWIIDCVGAVASTSLLSPAAGDEWEARRGRVWWNDQEQRSLFHFLALPGNVVCPWRRSPRPGGVGGQGCAGSVRLAPVRPVTKGRDRQVTPRQYQSIGCRTSGP